MQRQFDLPGRSAVYASKAAAATSHPLATTTALTILKEGGNAVDAAIAACATLCVVEPHMTGVGGDCFAIVCEPDGSIHGLNGSGRAPAASDANRLRKEGFTSIPETSAHAVTVPGAVKAWETLHQKFGRMDFKRLFADAIQYAEEGFAVTPRVASDWKELEEKLKGNKIARKNLLKADLAPNIGEKWQFPLLAATLRRVANEGAEAIYQGEIARDIADSVNALGGILNEEDLANVNADWVTPISTHYNGHVLHEIPPNGQGLTALIIARMLEKTGIADSADASQRAHLEMELGRIGYTARDEYISDPQHMAVDVDTLLSDDHITSLCGLYDPDTRNNNIALPDPAGSDTVYLSIVDDEQRAVSFINSVFGGFGSGIMTPRSGIILQNRGSGFNLREGHANEIGSSKRPLHTIIPAMVTHNGLATHCYGVMGGSYQAMGHIHVLSNMLDYGMDPQQALDDPRIFWDAAGNLELEAGISVQTEAFLKARGHKCARTGVHGGGQIIRIDHENGTLVAGSDPRKDGNAAGF